MNNIIRSLCQNKFRFNQLLIRNHGFLPIISTNSIRQFNDDRFRWKTFMNQSPDKVFDDFNKLFKNFEKFGEEFIGKSINRCYYYPTDIPINSKSLIVQDNNGEKKMKLKLYMNDFLAENIQLKTENNILYVKAKMEKKDPYFMKKEYCQSYALPKNVDIQKMQSDFSPNNILTISAPITSSSPDDTADKGQNINIEHN
ncbi:hypothetical protein SNEBB_008947 [Seison nebaliae]|nr:hypothetical protein SNEBB_008947 [Seison nebaliae]